MSETPTTQYEMFPARSDDAIQDDTNVVGFRPRVIGRGESSPPENGPCAKIEDPNGGGTTEFESLITIGFTTDGLFHFATSANLSDAEVIFFLELAKGPITAKYA